MDLLDIIVLIIISGFAITDNVVRNKSHAREKEAWLAVQMAMRDSLIHYCEVVKERDNLLTSKIEYQAICIELLEERLGKRIKIT